MMYDVMPRLLDLLTGTGSVAKVAREMGFEVTTLDIDPKTGSCDICTDIHRVQVRMRVILRSGAAPSRSFVF